MPKPTIGPMVLFIFQIILACSHLSHAGEDLAHEPLLLSKVLHFSGTGELDCYLYEVALCEHITFFEQYVCEHTAVTE